MIPCDADDPHTCADGAGNPDDTNGGNDALPMAGDVSVKSRQHHRQRRAVEIKLTRSTACRRFVPVGSTIVLYLEDDFAGARFHIRQRRVPRVSLLAAMNQDGTTTTATGSGARVYVTQNPVKIKTRTTYFDELTRRTSPFACPGSRYVRRHQHRRLRRPQDGLMQWVRHCDAWSSSPSSGIKNPSEAGIHSVGASMTVVATARRGLPDVPHSTTCTRPAATRPAWRTSRPTRSRST